MDRVLFAPRELPPLRADVAQDPHPYDTWVRARESERVGASGPDDHQKRHLHVVMLIAGQPPGETVESLRSLGRQRSTHWKLTVVAEERWRTEIAALLVVSGIAQHVAMVTLEEGTGFDHLLEAGLAASAGDDIALIFPGDLWAEDAIPMLSAALSDNGVVYADEDCLDPEGTHVRPRLKPAFSPEFLLHADLLGRPMVLAAGVAASLAAGSAEVEASKEHDLALRAAEVATSVRHIPEVLCHRLIPPSTLPGTPQGCRHVVAALARRGEDAVVEEGQAPGTVRIIRAPKRVTKASIIVPFRDEPRLLRSCFESLERTKGQIAHEYLLVDNGSTQPETMTLLERLSCLPEVNVVHDDGPFNWARLNNEAATRATGDVLVFLNNDIEAVAPGWLEALSALAERGDIGAVGGRLLYPDGRLQHCCVVLGLGGAAGHLFRWLPRSEPGYMAMAMTTRECSAVTGACLATRRSVFQEHGGFDQSLGVDLNDIDYCLRLQLAGLRVLFEPAAELLHHESPSRGTAGDPSDIVRFIQRWEAAIKSGDPYLSPHLTRLDSSCALRESNETLRWNQWYAGLREA